MASNGSSKAHLERLEEAERRKLEMEQKRAPPPRSASVASGSASASGNRGGSRPSRERSQRRNGTYILLLVTTLTATVGLNVAHHTITGGGAAQVSVRAAEAFLARHFNTAMAGRRAAAAGAGTNRHARSIVANMSLAAKIGQMSQIAISQIVYTADDGEV